MLVSQSGTWQRKYASRLFFTDLALLAVAIGSSQLIWFGFGRAELRIWAGQTAGFTLGYTIISIVLGLAWMIMLDYFATRDHKVIGSGTSEYKRIVDGTIRLFGVVAIVMYLLLKSELGRGYLLTALPLGLLLLLVGRWTWRQWLVGQRKKGHYSYKSLLVGDVHKSRHVAARIVGEHAAGIRVVGALTSTGDTTKALGNDTGDFSMRELTRGIPVLGAIDDMIRVIDDYDVDTVILTGSDSLGPRRMREIGWELDSRNVALVVAPALTDVAGPRIHARPVAGLPLIHVSYPSSDGPKSVAKRIFDIVASGIGLVLLSPALLVISLIVRRDSPGPAFFRQERVGHNGTPFKMVKFRSMVTSAEAQLPSLLDQSDGNGVLFKLKSDPRITKVGAVLRRYSIDELPQLINVFKGEMSLVGPRPPLAAEVKQYDGWAQRRLLVKPGITGLWQVSGRSDLSWDESIRLDLYYVENWSLTGDVIILYRTFRAIVRPTGAY